MTTYFVLKWLHIVASVLLVGTGFGSAFFLYFANRSGNLSAQAVVCRLVVRVDWWFVCPTAVIQPLSGIAMAMITGWSLTTPWLAASLALYILAGICWLPAIWLQLQMAKMAIDAHHRGNALPTQYWRYAWIWQRLGYPAFLAMLLVYYLMISKPSF